MWMANVTVMAQLKERSDIEEKYTWKLQDLYPSDEAWEAEKENQKARIPEVARFKGRLSKSPAELQQCLDLVTDLQKEMSRLYSYASMKSDLDTRVAKYQGMRQEMGRIFSDFSSQAAFISPEILAMEKAAIDKFITKNKALEVYRFDLYDILRNKAHTGTAQEEKIMAEAGLISGNSSNTYGIFSDAEFPFPSTTLSDGKEVQLNKANFTLYRASENREDRAKVFETFFTALQQFKATYGTMLYGEVKKNIFYKNVRNHQSSLHSALNRNNIPTEVYQSLIGNVNKNLDTFHRYLKLRQRILKVDQLNYYDLYAPLMKGLDLEFSVEESASNIVAALQPLGRNYTDVLGRAFNERWIDMYPSPGKRSGAYSNGSAYDVHPYILMNYNGKYDDMSTLAHELGHTMHSYLSNGTQPYAMAGYSIFVAEVASTFNEALLNHHMLGKINDDKVRLEILGSWLEGAKGTLFRQTQFAEFELKIHELAEQGVALTGEQFDKLYLDITRKYYGHDQGVCTVDDYVQAEWSYIPHFYYNFYVFQYATSFTASQALSEKVLAGDTATTDKYLKFLSSGGSKYPIELLQDTGIDMTGSEPFDLTMKKMNAVMDEIETILSRLNM
jgi:oligoendopeptidase F